MSEPSGRNHNLYDSQCFGGFRDLSMVVQPSDSRPCVYLQFTISHQLHQQGCFFHLKHLQNLITYQIIGQEPPPTTSWGPRVVIYKLRLLPLLFDYDLCFANDQYIFPFIHAWTTVHSRLWFLRVLTCTNSDSTLPQPSTTFTGF